MPHNPQPIAAAYIRVSTEDQTEYSPDAQLSAMQRYADANGLYLDPSHVYRDEGISGRSAAKRPGFQAMIAAAKRADHPFDVILVHKLDRFARSREDSVVYKSMLRRECNVNVVSITEPISDDKTAIIMEPILEAMAEYYSVNLSEEVKKGMTQKALSGGLQSAPSFGYLVENNVLVPDPDRAPYVVEIFKRYVSGEGMYPIARSLNARGVTTRRGGRFENRTVEYILRNPVYIGMIRWNPKGRTRRDFNNPDIITTRGKHEPLISQELWDAAQDLMKKQKAARPYKGKPLGVKRKHWLCGIVRCASCNSTLIIQSFKYGSYWHCGNHVRGRCLHTQNTRVDIIESAVLSRLRSDIVSTAPLHYYAARPESPSDTEAASLARSISSLERRLDRLRDAYLAGVETLDSYASAKRRIEADIESLRAELQSLTSAPDEDAICAQLRSALSHALTVFESDADTMDKASTASSVFDTILYDKDTGLLQITYKIFVS